MSNRFALASVVMALLTSTAIARADDLSAGFTTPSPSARPRVWWHWMNGNITLDGIDKDLAWMKRVGIVGVQNFDAAFGPEAGPLAMPQVTDKRLVFLTPEWRAAFRHAVEKADSYGFEFAIAGSPGWSESGGPWVTPQQAMKKLVWSELAVKGGRPVGMLPAPPAVSGPFQDVPGGGGSVSGAIGQLPSLYRDVAVAAYRVPPAEAAPLPAPHITSSAPIDAAPLGDGDLTHKVQLPFTPGADSWIAFDYGQPVTLRALKLVAAHSGGFGDFGAQAPEGRIEASADGVSFRPVADLPREGAPEQTIAFAATTARVFRVVFRAPAEGPAFGGLPGGPPLTSHGLAEVAFEAGGRIHRFEDKAGWSNAQGLADQPTPAAGSEAVVRREDIIDLTGKMRPDGTLDWTPPKGRWVVLRLGYSLTGRQNGPASPEGTGLEVDKLSREHVSEYAAAYLGEYEKSVGAGLMGKRGVQAMVTDSWEAGSQNWTEDMIGEFQRRRGYDPRPWLPVLTGRVVDSAQASEAFLWDFRKTIGDLIADNHYGALSDALHARGMRRYGESHENGRAFVGDGMQVKKSADVPMGATWAETPGNNGQFSSDADIRESASVAHIWGQNLVAAESFTTAGNPYGYSPETLKPVADRMMANGLNRFIIHTSVHQPVDTAGPGMGLAIFGQWFTRKETWAEQAGPWIDYLARSSQLLQQGRFVADVAYFYGEDGNITELFGSRLPAVPSGYAYDFVNADAVLNELQARDGRLVTASGMSYRVLAVDPSVHRLTVPVLRRMRDFKAAGVAIVGARPLASPSLADDPAEFQRLADEVFGTAGDLPAALTGAGLGPDLDDGGAGLRYVHRETPDGQIYFVSNPDAAAKSVDVSFRGAGMAAEVWRADDGSMTPTSYRSANGRTVVPLQLAPHDAVFVVFRGAGAPERTLAAPVRRQVAATTGSWEVRFDGAAAPKPASMDRLSSWSDSSDPQLRYYAGTATYSTSLRIPADALKGKGRLYLDLGEVKNLATVTLNGRVVGTAWKAPFQLDVTDAAKAGANTLEIKVANLWPNRLIGDRQPGAASPPAFATYNPYPPNAPLLPSGLLGPVTLTRASP